MELMVYSALIGVIVIIAGEAYSNSTKFRVRTVNMIKSSSLANNISSLLWEDLAQMGSKAALESGVGYHFYEEAYNGAGTDSASYVLNAAKDSISFRRVAYDDMGKALFLQQVSWYAKHDTLYRKCKSLEKLTSEDIDAPTDCIMLNDGDGDVDPVVMSDHVEQFTLQPGRRLQDQASCPSTDFAGGCFKLGSVYTLASRSSSGSGVVPVLTDRVPGSTATKLYGFFSNYRATTNLYSQVYVLNGTVASPSWNQCSEFTFKSNVTYGVTFSLVVKSSSTNVNYMRNFQAEYDHVSVGFRDQAGEPIPGIQDHMVYPAQNDLDGDRYFEFSFPTDVTGACLAFTFAFYSQHAADGSMEVSNLSVFPRDESGYDFASPGTDKRNHKAFRYTVKMKVGGESTVIEKFVPTPNNGI